MKTVKHRFLDYPINPDTETLILGTFNPDTPENNANFFYGRSRNFLWRLLPTAYDETDLKKATKQEKIDFINKYNISLVDLIVDVQVDEGQEANYYDGYIDNKVSHWRDIKGVIDKLPNLKRVGFTRKTFSDIPNMKTKIENIQEYCISKGIHFKSLTTPARFYREDKQIEWTNFLTDDIK